MKKVMKAQELVNKAKDIAKNYKTLYVMGCFGAPMNATNKKRYTSNYSYNKQASRVKMINSASSDTFGFDCVCLIKGILWGWNGDKSKHTEEQFIKAMVLQMLMLIRYVVLLIVMIYLKTLLKYK